MFLLIHGYINLKVIGICICSAYLFIDYEMSYTSRFFASLQDETHFKRSRKYVQKRSMHTKTIISCYLSSTRLDYRPVSILLQDASYDNGFSSVRRAHVLNLIVLKAFSYFSLSALSSNTVKLNRIHSYPKSYQIGTSFATLNSFAISILNSFAILCSCDNV